MLKKDELNEYIADLKSQKNHTKSDLALLSSLYTIVDHAFEQEEPTMRAYSQAAAPIATKTALDRYGDSDFLLVVAGKMPDAAWAVMDDLMDTLRVVNPRVYESVMRKMRQL